MSQVTLSLLTQQLELADQLLMGAARMFEPQDLPGRYGRVIQSLDHILAVLGCEAVVAGGWAVWRHGFAGRITQDVDIVLPAEHVEGFLQAAAVSGFQILTPGPGRWPKVLHKETQIQVDILPEGQRPGTPDRPAPTLIPHPRRLGAAGPRLRYLPLPDLVELKLAAGRVRDEADVAALISTNPNEIARIRAHLATIHADYLRAFDALVVRARREEIP